MSEVRKFSEQKSAEEEEIEKIIKDIEEKRKMIEEWPNLENLPKPKPLPELGGPEGLRESGVSEDPFLFTAERAKLSVIVRDVMTSKIDEKEFRKVGIKPEVARELKKINEEVEDIYNNWLTTIEQDRYIPEEDKTALLHPEESPVKMTPLLEIVKTLVARCITQLSEKDPSTELGIEGIQEYYRFSSTENNFVKKGLMYYRLAYEMDIPLYDRIYAKFDKFREDKKNSLEVYLGRDGIYAYLGRRAQDVAKQRKIGWKRRKELKEKGKILKINPRYLVYPRYFHDNLNKEVKRRYLEQEGISKEADPIFFDVGHRGTIPEQIMKIMGFEDEEIEKRIFMLESSVSTRGAFPESYGFDLAEQYDYIEHNYKSEHTATGLYIDPKTNKIKYVARPTFPKDQFYFSMIKQALTRHFWLKEMLKKGEK